MAQKFKFNDGEFEVPGKIKCSCCGREVMGYPKLVVDRVYKQFGGEWQRYIAEWKCGNCKREANEGLMAGLNAQRLQDKLDKAIKLLEEAGYVVTKKEVSEETK